jgi:hypothetical protein
MEKFNTFLETGDVSKFSSHFHEDCYWRDMLTLTWDFRTIHAVPKVTEFLTSHLLRSKLGNCQIRKDRVFGPSLESPTEGLHWIQSMFDFETAVGFATGVLRLVQDENGDWKAFAISTTLQELRGHKESTGALRHWEVATRSKKALQKEIGQSVLKDRLNF